MRCLILLFLVGSAFAQPEWYAVWNSHYTIRDHEICVRGDTVDVLYSSEAIPDIDSLVFTYFPYNITLTQLGNLYNFGIPSSSYYSDFIDMTAVSPQQWACLLHMNTRGESWGYGQYFFQTELLSGNSRDVNTVEVESSGYSDFPDHHSGSWTEGHSLRVRNNRATVSYIVGDAGPFDVWYTVSLREFDLEFQLQNQTDNLGSMGSTYNERLNRVVSQSLPVDSVIAFTSWGSAVSLFLGPISEEESWTHTYVPDCGFRDLRELYVTHSNRIIAAFSDNSLFQIVPHNPDTADCTPFAQLPTSWSPSWAFHPNYGFAAVQALPGYLLLSRIDTSGNETQPVGVLYETDGTSFIVDADVTISDSGKVIAVWSEYTDWNEGPHVLKITWTDWTTYLDTPEQQAPAIPSEVSLSSYPNPFNSTVTIKYNLQQASRVSLSIFDIRGRLVETLRDDFTPSGSHTLAWSPTELASGVYFVRLNADHVPATSKLLYLK